MLGQKISGHALLNSLEEVYHNLEKYFSTFGDITRILGTSQRFHLWDFQTKNQTAKMNSVSDIKV